MNNLLSPTAVHFVRTQLLETKAQLIQNEAILLAQLQAIREGLDRLNHTLKTGGTIPTTSPDAATLALSTPEPLNADPMLPLHSNGQYSNGRSPVSALPSPSPIPIASDRNATKPPRQKRIKPPQGWGTYLHDEFKALSLNEMILKVLQRRFDIALPVAQILDSIIVNEAPEAERQTVHQLILSILVVGVENQRWYEVFPGFYSLCPEATLLGYVQSHSMT